MSLPDPEEKVSPLHEASAAYTIARERYMVLGECLTLIEAMKRRISRNEASHEAKPGYETAFDEEERRLRIIREMMIEERSRVDKAIQEIARIRAGEES